MGVQCGIVDETLRTKRRFWKAFRWRYTNAENHILGDFILLRIQLVKTSRQPNLSPEAE